MPKTKNIWAVRWRRHNPISWVLCGMFEHQYPYFLWDWTWSGVLLCRIHRWFCPDGRGLEIELNKQGV